jgi:precorrin-6B methylase 2
MSTHKPAPETSDLEGIDNPSASKRALLAQPLRESKPASSDYPDSKSKGATTLIGGLLRQLLVLIKREDEIAPGTEIIALIEQAEAEMAALQQKAEGGEIDADEWINIRHSLLIGTKMLAKRYPQSLAIQQRCLRFVIEHNLVNKLMDDPKYKFTHDLFTTHIKQWEKDFGFLKGRPNLRFVEIGSFEGRSTCWLLEHILTHETSTIICIDPFNEIDQPRQEEYFDFNIKQTGMAHKVTKLRGLSQFILKFLPTAAFDFVYIDGSHEARDILQDALLSWDALKRYGVLVFDDYQYTLPFTMVDTITLQPKQAIDAFLSLVTGRYQIIHKGRQVALRKLY